MALLSGASQLLESMIFKGTTGRTHFATVRQVCPPHCPAHYSAPAVLVCSHRVASRVLQAENYGVTLSSLSTRESMVFLAQVRCVFSSVPSPVHPPWQFGRCCQMLQAVHGMHHALTGPHTGPLLCPASRLRALPLGVSPDPFVSTCTHMLQPSHAPQDKPQQVTRRHAPCLAANAAQPRPRTAHAGPPRQRGSCSRAAV